MGQKFLPTEGLLIGDRPTAIPGFEPTVDAIPCSECDVIRISKIGREMLQRALEERQRQSPRIQLRTAWQQAARRNGQKWMAYPKAVSEVSKRLNEHAP